MDYDIKELPKISRKPGEFDERGFLIEFLKHHELKEDSKQFAQIYLATIAPKTIRGNHFHKTKDEFFIIMSGKAKIILEDINTKERKEILLDASKDHITRVRFGPFTAHVIQNISDEKIYLAAYATKPYNPENPDDEAYQLI